MADPVGTIGAKQVNDMDLVLEGGPTFEDRLRELEQHRTQAARALKDLNLGQAAALALREAKDKSTEAEQARASAVKVLADAQGEAAHIIANAKAEVQQTVQGAQKQALAKNIEADKIVKAAQDEATAMLAKAKEAEANAKAYMVDAQRTRDTIKESQQLHLAARNEAASAKQTADKKAAKFQEKINRLQEVLRELSLE